MTNFVKRTVGDVVSEILMSRSAFRGSFFVVEGDSDIRFWQTRVIDKACQMVLAGGKPTVIGAIIQANKLHQFGILGVIDDDFDSLQGHPLPSNNFVRTDTRDLEMLMLRSDALDRIVWELGDAKKVRAFEQAGRGGVRDGLVARSLIFGELRYLNAINGWNVDCNILRPWRFADVPTWSFRREDVLRLFSAHVPGLTIADLERQVAALCQLNPWSILHGKSTLEVLAVGLRNVISNNQHPSERIAQMLRLAFDKQLFQATELHSSIREWEARNAPYQILPP